MGRDYGSNDADYQSKAVEAHADNPSGVRILAVGDPDEWAAEGNVQPISGQISFLSIYEVSADTLEHLQPAMIYSPVLARRFDCIELAVLLEKCGFEGTYRAFATKLPKPEMIEREVRQMCPHFTFEIIQG